MHFVVMSKAMAAVEVLKVAAHFITKGVTFDRWFTALNQSMLK